MTTDTTRPVHHRGQVEELDPATCRALLATVPVARVVHVLAGEPQLSLVNVAVDGDDVVVRSTSGERLRTALATPGTSVLVEADAVDPTTRSGWSVIARGRMTPVLDQVTAARLDRAAPPSWILGDSGGTWLRMTIDEVSGRRVSGSVGA